MPKAKQQTKAVTKPKRGAGRPKVEINWEQVGKMLEAGATTEGIAATLGCDRDTLYIRCKGDLKLDFSALRQQKLAKGDELLRTKQFQIAMSGDKTMLIWLGKQRLGQAEKTHNEHTGSDGGPIETNGVFKIEIVDD